MHDTNRALPRLRLYIVHYLLAYTVYCNLRLLNKIEEIGRNANDAKNVECSTGEDSD